MSVPCVSKKRVCGGDEVCVCIGAGSATLTVGQIYGSLYNLLEGPSVFLPAADLHLTAMGLGQELQSLTHTNTHTQENA